MLTPRSIIISEKPYSQHLFYGEARYSFVGRMQLYQHEISQFFTDETIIKEKVQATKKDAVVFFFSVYEENPYEAINDFYNDFRNFCAYHFARRFHVFRVLIDSRTQITPVLKKIRIDFLAANQATIHINIVAHSNYKLMNIGNKRCLDDYLDFSDPNTFSCMREAFEYLDEDASIGLFACSVAEEWNSHKNIARCLSMESVAKGRIVSGAPIDICEMSYMMANYQGKLIPFPYFFKGGGVVLSADFVFCSYRNGEKIADLAWKRGEVNFIKQKKEVKDCKSSFFNANGANFSKEEQAVQLKKMMIRSAL